MAGPIPAEKTSSVPSLPKQQSPSTQQDVSNVSTLLQRGRTSPSALRASEVLTLQRKLGNGATRKLFRSSSQPPVQAKLEVGPAGDIYELEADRIANQVMQGEVGSQAHDSGSGPTVQKKPLAASVSRMPLRPAPPPVPTPDQTVMRDTEGGSTETHSTLSYGMEGGPLEQGLETRIQSARSGGQPLEQGVLSRMESGFGTDFGSVRIHTGSEANSLNQSLSSRAFTLGSDIFFRDGAYNPTTPEGGHLLAHELTHTLQQTGDGLQRQTALQRAAIGVIQRAIGMELECTNLAIKGLPADAAKKDVIVSDGANANMTVEATMETTPVVEFVIDPAAETKDQFINAIKWMTAWARKMDRDGGATIGDFYIKKEGAIEGAIQTTMGLPISALPTIYPDMGDELTSGGRSFGYKRFLELVKDNGADSKKTPDGRYVKDLPAASKGFILILLDTLKRGYVPEEFRKTFKPPPAPIDPGPFTEVAPEKFSGGANVFDRYMKHSARAAWKARKAAHEESVREYTRAHAAWQLETKAKKKEWVKSGEQFEKALLDAMPRSSFTTIFRSLPVDEARAFIDVTRIDEHHARAEMKPEWIDWLIKYGTEPDKAGASDATAAAKFMDARKDESLFNTKIVGRSKVGSGPNRAEWLKHMPMYDMLQQKGFMGICELKDKTDVFADNPSEKAPIFEFRKPYASSVPYTQWLTKAQETWDVYWKATGKRKIERGKKKVT